MNDTITAVRAMEILDSRGNPTVRVFVELADHTTVSASSRPEPEESRSLP